MTKLIVVAGAVGMLLFQSCASDKKTETESETISSEQPVTPTDNVFTDTAQIQPATQSADINSSAPVINAAPATNNSPVAAGMNPAHGEPGHRCDIAVGAPLNSAPNKQEATTPAGTSSPSMTPITSTPQIMQSAPVTTPAATPAGMNPAHGQPGHDCTIAVGAPLKK